MGAFHNATCARGRVRSWTQLSAGGRSRSRGPAAGLVSWFHFRADGDSSREMSLLRCHSARQRSTRTRSVLIRKRRLISGHTMTPIAAERSLADASKAEHPVRGMLDTNVIILRRWVAASELPEEMAISAVTLAELSAGPHQVRSGRESAYDEHAERARRLELLQRTENEFDPIPFDVEAARSFGRVVAAVIALGRSPRRRIADLLIAATAIAVQLPLFTTNPADFAGLEALLEVVPVKRPNVPASQRGD